MAEAIDAHQVLAKIGYTDRELTKNALAITLAKTIDEKQRFARSFDVFFHGPNLVGMRIVFSERVDRYWQGEQEVTSLISCWPMIERALPL